LRGDSSIGTIKLPEKSEIVAAFDADSTGRMLVEIVRAAVLSVASKTERTDLIFRAHLPTQEGEDWNQVLQNWTCQKSSRQETISCPG
jgi:hypothetical protein